MIKIIIPLTTCFVLSLLSGGCTVANPYNIKPIPTGAIEYAAYKQDIGRCEKAAKEAPTPQPKIIPSRTSVNFGLGIGTGFGYYHNRNGFGGVGVQHQFARTTTEQEERQALVVECLQAKGYNSSL